MSVAPSSIAEAPVIELRALNRTYRTEEVEVRAVRDVSLVSQLLGHEPVEHRGALCLLVGIMP